MDNNYNNTHPKKISASNMLNAKKSGRVFYPSKVHHSRHNSHDGHSKGQREDLSPLNRSHDSTCDSSSGSSSKDGSGSKLAMAQHRSERLKEIVPIRLNFDDEPSTIVPTLIVEVTLVSGTDNIEYELEQNDVQKVFEKFGPVKSVEIHGKTNKAVVIMEDAQHGQQAEKYLNFYQLPGTNAYLTVKWQFGDFEGLQRAAMIQKSGSQLTNSISQDQTIINKFYQSKDAQNQNSVNEGMGSLSATPISSQFNKESSQYEDSSKLGVSRE
jgi:hypothetical protein